VSCLLEPQGTRRTSGFPDFDQRRRARLLLMKIPPARLLLQEDAKSIEGPQRHVFRKNQAPAEVYMLLPFNYEGHRRRIRTLNRLSNSRFIVA